MELADILNKNVSLKNIHSGRRCFIVGNGPSLGSQDLLPLRDEVTFVVSWFHRHQMAKEIHPNYWVLADPAFWEREDQPFLQAIRHVLSLTMSTKLFVPVGGFSRIATVNPGPLLDIHYFNYVANKGIDTPIDFSGGIPPFGQNVVVVCLMLSFFMGCNPIYLVGCDHDFLAISKDQYDNKDEKHFYKEEKTAVYAEKFAWDEFRGLMSRLVYEYDQLKLYADRWGFDVFNATRGGCLEHFPRVEYESLFNPGLNDPYSGDQSTTTELSSLTQTANRLLNAGEDYAALVLIDQALRKNTHQPNRIKGLNFLKALTLSKLDRFGEALQFARQDYNCNATNRDKSEQLILHLEKVVAAGNLDKSGQTWK